MEATSSQGHGRKITTPQKKTKAAPVGEDVAGPEDELLAVLLAGVEVVAADAVDAQHAPHRRRQLPARPQATEFVYW